jgi:hypothetical protein
MTDERKTIYSSDVEPTNLRDYVCPFHVIDEHTGGLMWCSGRGHVAHMFISEPMNLCGLGQSHVTHKFIGYR